MASFYKLLLFYSYFYQVLDTVGAGDTFNAGLIRALCRAKQGGVDISTDATVPGNALEYACKLAGAKVGMNGFEGLKELNI